MGFIWPCQKKVVPLGW